LPEVGGPFFFPIMKGIENCAHEKGYNLLIHTVSTPLESGPRMLPLGLGEHNTDGLIVFAHSLKEQELRRLHGAGFPMVLLHQSAPTGLDIPNVTFENKSGASKVVEHLIVEHGYRRIAFMAGPKEHEDSYWREMGYVEALHTHRIDFDPKLIMDGYFDPERARQSVEQMLRDGLEVDAIFAADDESASGAMMALREAGLRIPEDIAVVGFDDTLLASHLTPALTTVHAPIEQAGWQAAEQLIKKIAGEPTEAVTLLPTEVIIRKSCGC
jgi:LacI family transcriptional regulator